MDTKKFRKWAHAFLLCITFGLASCGFSKKKQPEVVSKSTAPSASAAMVEQKNSEPMVDEPVAMLPVEDHGIRMPDMLALPAEGEFRATNPSLPRSGNEPGAVISRPPTDPPLRIKPKPEAVE
jgi:hypothetical protein